MRASPMAFQAACSPLNASPDSSSPDSSSPVTDTQPTRRRPRAPCIPYGALTLPSIPPLRLPPAALIDVVAAALDARSPLPPPVASRSDIISDTAQQVASRSSCCSLHTSPVCNYVGKPSLCVSTPKCLVFIPGSCNIRCARYQDR